MKALILGALTLLGACSGMSLPGGGGSGAATTPAGPFSARSYTDPATGWEILALQYDDREGRGGRLEARIAPAAGGNLFSLQVDDLELMRQPERMEELAQHRAGTPVLFPTPNRVRDARFSFGGEEFRLPANSGANSIHGLVRSLAWESGVPSATDRAATATAWVDWNDSRPDFGSFPIRHRLTLTYTLHAGGVRIGYAVENRDQRPLPFGFGLHPWFRVPGRREDVRIFVPADRRMEAVDRLPTGRLLPVGGSAFDLRRPAALTDLALDDVYFGLGPRDRPGFHLLDRGVRVTLRGSPEFGHLVVYTPADQPFFCIENQTSSTDAHNLFAQGYEEESGLQIVPPGATATGWVDWEVKRRSAE